MSANPDQQKILIWSEVHSYLLMAGLLASAFLQELYPLVLIALSSFSYYGFTQRTFLQTLQPFAGYANWVTFLRLLLVCAATAFYQELSNLYLFLIFTSSVLLDVFDGYLARKYKHVSDFGLYFDMEADAFFVAVVATILYKKGMVGSWVLVPAYLRYVYMLVLKILPIEIQKEPKRSYASIIAGCFFVSLLLPFILPHSLYRWPLYICGFAIVISFAISFRYQIQGQVSVEEEAHTKTPF